MVKWIGVEGLGLGVPEYHYHGWRMASSIHSQGLCRALGFYSFRETATPMGPIR